MLIQEFERYQVHRFYCECLTPGDCIDITLDHFKEEKEISQFSISICNDSGKTLWGRVKAAFLYISRKKDLYYTEVVLSPKNANELAELLSKKELK